MKFAGLSFFILRIYKHMKKIIKFLSVLMFSGALYAADTVKVIIPFAPGGGVDQTMRHFEKWAAKKNIKLVPIYKPGAEGLIGMNELAVSSPDGSFISFATVATLAVQRIKNPESGVIPLTGIKTSVMAVITNVDSDIKQFSDLYNGKNEKTFGQGAPAQKLFIDQMIQQSQGKIKAISVPYKGGAPVIQDILGNHISVGVVPLQIVKSQIDSGKVRLLAVGSKNRLSEFPNVPSIFEFFKSWKNNDGFVVVLPKGVSPAAVEYWNSILLEYTTNKDVLKDFSNEYTEIIQFGVDNLELLVNSAINEMKQ